MVLVWLGCLTAWAREAPVDEQPRKELQGWERPTLYTGLGVMGASVLGATVTHLVLQQQCRSNPQSECMSAVLVPVGVGAMGLTLGGFTALVGGAGILAAPRQEPTVALTVSGRF